jgi:O-antigen/teichoic acid export membrane protein
VSAIYSKVTRGKLVSFMRWLTHLRNGFHYNVTARNGLIALADQAVVSAGNFFVGIIIGRVCSKEQYGIYMLGFSIVLFFINLQATLILSPYTVYSPRLKDAEHSQYTGSILIHQLGLDIFSIIALSVCGLILSFSTRWGDLTTIVWLLAIVIIFILLKEYVRGVCFAGLQTKTVLLLDIFGTGVQISFIVILAYFNLLSAYTAYLLIGVVSGTIALGWLTSRKLSFSMHLKRSIYDFQTNWSFAKWVFAGNTTFLISSQLYPWFLASFWGTSATATFSACWSITALINPLLLGIGNFLGPKMAHARRRGVQELYYVANKATIYLTILTGLFVVAMLLFGNQFVILAYGVKYAGNGAVVSILGLGILASAVSVASSYGLWAMERSGLNFKINLISLGVTLSFGLLLVKFFGPIGVAFGLLLGNTLASTVRYFSFNRSLQLN